MDVGGVQPGRNATFHGLADETAQPSGKPSWAVLPHNGPLAGLRAVAVVLVVLFHAGLPWLPAGFVGVDVFFVLSGFLITSLIVREVWSTRRLDLVGFWARRARRLLPVALVVLTVTAIAYAFAAPAIDVATNRNSFPAASLYVSNWLFAQEAVDYFADNSAKSPVLHFWSLSIEEQFYLVWPLVALVILLLAFRRVVAAITAVSALAAASFAYAYFLASSSPEAAYFSTFARAWQLLAGALVALIVLVPVMRNRPLPEWVRPLATVSAPVALAAIVLAASPIVGGRPPLVASTVATLATVVVVASVWLLPNLTGTRWLAAPFAQLIGRLSYGIYLWHWPFIIIGGLLGLTSEYWVVNVPVVLLVSTGLAAVTYVAVERPMSALSLRPRRRAVLVLVACLTAAGLVAAGTWTYLRPPSNVSAVIDQLDNDAQEAAVGELTAGAASGAKVLLVGDSHAGFWQPALDALGQEQGWQLKSVIRASCPWALVTVVEKSGKLANCDVDLSSPAIQTAADYRPDVTILASRSIQIDSVMTEDGRTLAPLEAEWLPLMSAGATKFIDELLEYSATVVLIEPTPETRKHMVRCVTAGAEVDCDLPANYKDSRTEIVTLFRSLAAENPRVISLALDDLICPNGTCPALVDQTLTYRDLHHLTSDYALLLMPGFDALLRAQSVTLAQPTSALDSVAVVADSP